MDSQGLPVICALVFKSQSRILTIQRDRHISLPIIETPHEEDIITLAKRDLCNLISIRNLSGPQPIGNRQCRWGIEEQNAMLFFYTFSIADVIPIGTGTTWDNIYLRDPRFDVSIGLLRELIPSSRQPLGAAA